ncbi:two-component system regulatory protein YycI [Tuberibacillus sp. Marseille-P3662]|uniref:two-component system regulatory protein YycI n=1 Tax=Tuberibacillus sp. Marseille-P3662 TaxID=1965358 RepID=UPI000A1CDE01|nr:two-component system regulatory protein YycI [Tuberibacillus sp. Marseille-P3662]
MNWSRTKSIFIICFLLLDLFLGYQLYKQQKANQLESISDVSVPNFESTVKIDTQLPSKIEKVKTVKGDRIAFKKDDNTLIKELQSLKGTEDDPVLSFTSDGSKLRATFHKKVEASESQTGWRSFLEDYVYKGSEYRFWSYQEEQNEFTFVQTYQHQPVIASYKQDTTTKKQVVPQQEVVALNVKVDKEGYVKGYTQTYLDLESVSESTPSVVDPKKAIQILWDENKLPVTQNPVITKVELSYYSISNPTGTSQGPTTDEEQTLAFAPSWHVVVESDRGTEDYFVVAVGGSIQTLGTE